MKEKLEYVKEKILKKEYQILPNTIAEGTVYKIANHGSLEKDGIEYGFLFIPKGSGIKLHKHTNDIEIYQLVLGKLSVKGQINSTNICLLMEEHNIDIVDEDTIIETIKVSKDKIINDAWKKDMLEMKSRRRI